MTLAEDLLSVWHQVMADGRGEVELRGLKCSVTKTRGRGLRTVSFASGDQVIDGVEQNPEKDSRWGKLAREGSRIMQFSCRRRFFANVCDGHLLRYPAWKSLGLPE